jgi:hypothetical protein
MTPKIQSLIELNSHLDAILFATQDEDSTLGKIAKGAATIGALGLAGYGVNSLLKKNTGKGIADYAGQLANKVGSSVGSLASSVGSSAGSGVSIVPSMRSSFPSSSVVNSAQNALYSTPKGLLN